MAASLRKERFQKFTTRRLKRKHRGAIASQAKSAHPCPSVLTRNKQVYRLFCQRLSILASNMRLAGLRSAIAHAAAKADGILATHADAAFDGSRDDTGKGNLAAAKMGSSSSLLKGYRSKDSSSNVDAGKNSKGSYFCRGLQLVFVRHLVFQPYQQQLTYTGY